MSKLNPSETKLLTLLVSLLNQNLPNNTPKNITYTEACMRLELDVKSSRTPGDVLDAYAMRSLAEWLAKTGKPAITGLIVNERNSLPSIGFWNCFNKQPEDLEWRLSEIEKARLLDWSEWIQSPHSSSFRAKMEDEQFVPDTPKAEDFIEPIGEDRKHVVAYRILRDSVLAREVKRIHGWQCQVCNAPGLELHGGQLYAEAHHIKPLGGSHLGRDKKWNILCVCPTCHIKLDYGTIRLDANNLSKQDNHEVSEEMIDYHNEKIFAKRQRESTKLHS